MGGDGEVDAVEGIHAPIGACVKSHGVELLYLGCELGVVAQSHTLGEGYLALLDEGGLDVRHIVEVDELGAVELDMLAELNRASVKPEATLIALDACFFGVCALKLHCELLFIQVADLVGGCVAFTVFLVYPVKGGEVMISRLHKPELISVLGEGLLGV